MTEEQVEKNRAVLVGAGEDRQMGELARLAETLGLEVVGVLEQGRRDGAAYLGRGKREELKELVVEAEARDASSRLEVELAELTYRLPRVRGGYTALSRLGGGGVTTRGPGEQQLEYDRRVIRRRMETIRKRLQEEKAAREVRGARLRKEGPPSVALVGYTNAGKTTILNSLSGENRSTADRLFETLETTTRLIKSAPAENGRNGPVSRPDFVLTDTVGFIMKLPTQLVHSFASTLEAAEDADVIILCADASSERLEEEIRTVEDTLAETFAGNGTQGETILCLNKADLV